MRKAIAACTSEGGEWLPWPLNPRHGLNGRLRLHAILHDDGSIWDEGQGWRDQSPAEMAQSIAAVIKIQQKAD
jgi:hypothetical protein